MPVIEFKAKESSGWQPLPNGTYDFQILSVDPTKVSEAGNSQMMVKMQVVGGDKEGKDCTSWYPIGGNAGWRLKNLLEATGVDYEENETGEVDKDNEPLLGYKFNSDDLPSTMFRADVSQREYPKGSSKFNNDFANERSVDDVPATSTPANGGAKPAAAAAPAQAAPARTPTAAVAGVRRPRV